MEKIIKEYVKDNVKVKGEVVVDLKWMVYRNVVKEIVKLDCDGVVRLYNRCESIEEGLLG